MPPGGTELILADAPIWIEHFRSGNEEPCEQLNRGKTVIHPFVVAELALGPLRQRSKILSLLDLSPRVQVAQVGEVRMMIRGSPPVQPGHRFHRRASNHFCFYRFVHAVVDKRLCKPAEGSGAARRAGLHRTILHRQIFDALHERRGSRRSLGEIRGPIGRTEPGRWGNVGVSPATTFSGLALCHYNPIGQRFLRTCGGRARRAFPTSTSRPAASAPRPGQGCAPWTTGCRSGWRPWCRRCRRRARAWC